MASTDLEGVLTRLASQYKQDVFRWHDGANRGAIEALEAHLRRKLPPDYCSFLGRHNGAELFRGALRLRATSDVTGASDDVQQVVLFADGPEQTAWGWAIDRDDAFVYGRWDGRRLEPVAQTFDDWLLGALAVIESGPLRAVDEEVVRREAAPHDPWIVRTAAARAEEQGDLEQAERLYRVALDMNAYDVRAWERLGRLLAVRDLPKARPAWLEALRKTSLPVPWPGAPCVSLDTLQSLEATQDGVSLLQSELRAFLDSRFVDVRSSEGLQLVTYAALFLSRELNRAGKRSDTRALLSDVLARIDACTYPEMSWEVLLRLARVDLELGHHEECEKLLRRARLEAPSVWALEAELLLAELIVARQEPWVEDVFERIEANELSPGFQLRLGLLRAEHCIRQEQADDAERQLGQVIALHREWGAHLSQATVCLLEGDIARLRGDLDTARSSWRDALDKTGTDEDGLAHRVELRMGDLMLARKDVRAAYAWYTRAVAGYSNRELRMRLAWGHLRLGRVGLALDDQDAEAYLRLARDAFASMDFAAGVAGVDAARGHDADSLGWHLERTTAHGRRRYDAQRSRPPSTHADAERPERMVAAHRQAIAASGQGVLDALRAELDACARAMAVGRGRPTDPPVLRYIAGVDLLSGHRSFEAAEILLEHLFERRVEGHAYLALQGAVARSMNVALVDGLLRCVESPDGRTVDEICLAASSLGVRRSAESVEPLVALAGEGMDEAVRAAAVRALGRIGDPSSVASLAECLATDALAEHAALALLIMGDARGLHFHREALTHGRTDLSGHPAEIVGRYGGPENLLLLKTVAQQQDDVGRGALLGLGLLGDTRGAGTILAALRSREPSIVAAASGALTILTGHQEQADEPNVRQRWEQWWHEHGASLQPGIRYRGGQAHAFGTLLEEMEHVDPYVRRTAYDELVISSGSHLPFDADGPWRVQRAHLKAWRRWWARHREAFPPGAWFLAGRPQ